MAKKVSRADLAVLDEVLRGLAEGREPDRDGLAVATRTACRLLAERHPGGFVELRVPPLAAVQLGIGDRGDHHRGTPPNVVETPPLTFLQLAAGTLSWDVAVRAHTVSASGAHADLSEVFPLRV